MKLRNIITSLVVALVAITACTKEELGYLKEVKVSHSYLTFPQSGGTDTLRIQATDSWTITDIPEWLTVSPSSGSAGNHEVIFSAGATTETYQTILYLNCAGAQQQLTVLQQAAKVETPISSCEEVNKGEDGKTYKICGTVTSISNTKYGNLYINDGTGEVYIYGTLYEGQEEKFLEHGIEVGDKVTVEGPRKTYNGTIELVNVTVINIEKSLIKVEEVSPEDATLPIEGGEFTVTLTCKGDGVKVIVDESIQSWVQVSGISTSGNTAVVTFKVAANPGGDREAEVSFETTSGGEKYTAKTSFTQKGAIIDATVASFLAAEESSTLYRVTGVIKSISASAQYHNASIYLLGGSGEEVQLYRAVGPEGTNIEDLGLAEGDIVTFLGKRSSYNGTPQMAAGGVYESHTHYEAKTTAEFIAAKDANNPYLVKGTIVGTPSVSAQYNNANFTIKDESGELYIYRAASFDKTAIETIGLEEGKVVTIAGKYGEYKDNPQMTSGGLILMVEEGQTPTPPPATGAEYDITINYEKGTNCYDDGAATINDVSVDKTIKLGTSKAAGDVTFTIPKGTKKVSFYAVAWKGAATTLECYVGETKLGSQAIVANDGATGNAPYTLTVADSDKYVIEYNFTEDTKVKVTTAEGAKTRAILFGIKAQ